LEQHELIIMEYKDGQVKEVNLNKFPTDFQYRNGVENILCIRGYYFAWLLIRHVFMCNFWKSVFRVTQGTTTRLITPDFPR